MSDKYKVILDKPDLPKGDKLNTINDALTELHVIMVGSGKVSVIEAKNFRFFVK